MASWYCLLIVSTRREIGWFPLSAPPTSVAPHKTCPVHADSRLGANLPGGPCHGHGWPCQGPGSRRPLPGAARRAPTSRARSGPSHGPDVVAPSRPRTVPSRCSPCSVSRIRDGDGSGRRRIVPSRARAGRGRGGRVLRERGRALRRISFRWFGGSRPGSGKGM
ncbi:predicted protein [Streptomyces albidoflavus]|nr:predicted protein [Streptomyces albidoflavus]